MSDSDHGRGTMQVWPDARTKQLIVAIIAVAAVILSFWQVLDGMSRDSIDRILVQAVSAYGVARIADGTLSLLQSFELSIPIIGGAAISPLMVLSPWHDLIARFSALMELAIGSLLLQRILIDLASTLFFQIIYACAGLLFLLSHSTTLLRPGRIWFRLFLSLSFLRFGMVAIALCNGVVDQAFMREKTTDDLTHMSQLSQAVASAEGTPEEIQLRRSKIERMTTLRQTLLQLEEERKDILQLQEDDGELAANVQERLSKESSGKTVRQRLRDWSRGSSEESGTQKAGDALQQRQQQLVARLMEIEQTIPVIRKQIAESEQDLQGKTSVLMKRLATEGSQLFDVMAQKINDVLDTVIRLLVLFMLQTLLLPLLFLWCLRKAVKWLWHQHTALPPPSSPIP